MDCLGKPGFYQEIVSFKPVSSPCYTNSTADMLDPEVIFWRSQGPYLAHRSAPQQCNKNYLWNGNQLAVGFSSKSNPAGTQGLVYNALQVEK